LTFEKKTHYNSLSQKLDKLVNRQHHKSSADTSTQGHRFYTRTINLTNINLTLEETILLNNGLQHSIEKPLDRYWTDLMIETEQAIRTIEANMHNPMTILAITKLK
jgi:hypothetical protein